MTIAEVHSSASRHTWVVTEGQMEMDLEDNLVFKHEEGLRGSVALYQRESVPDPDKPGSMKWILTPIEGATNIQPGIRTEKSLTLPGHDTPTVFSVEHWAVMH